MQILVLISGASTLVGCLHVKIAIASQPLYALTCVLGCLQVFYTNMTITKTKTISRLSIKIIQTEITTTPFNTIVVSESSLDGGHVPGQSIKQLLFIKLDIATPLSLRVMEQHCRLSRIYLELFLVSE